MRNLLNAIVFLLMFLALAGCAVMDNSGSGPSPTPTPAPDTTPPVVTAASPANGTIGVATNLAAITMSFSEAVTGIDPSSYLVSGNVLGSVSYNPVDKTATFIITNGNLAVNSNYSVTLTSGIKDTAGNALAETNFSFTTGAAGDSTAPGWLLSAASNVLDTSLNLNFKINEDGKIYYIVINSGLTAPNAGQLTNGANYSGVIVLKAGSITSGHDVESTVNITGLSPETDYDIYVIALDNYGNLGAIPLKVTVKTLFSAAHLAVADSWTTGNLTAGHTNWYYFDVSAGQNYAVNWDDGFASSGDYTGDLQVSAFKPDLIIGYFIDVDNAYHTPQTFQADSGGRVYLRVIGYFPSSSGTYALKVKQFTPRTISGTITIPAEAVTANDTTNYINVNGSLYTTNIILSAGATSCAYSISGLMDGNYTISSWIDINKSGGGSQDSGDCIGSTDVIISADKTVNFSVSLCFTITGTITLPADQNGKFLLVSIHNSNYTYNNGTAIMLGSGTTCTYSIDNVPPGTYAITVWVDVDDNGSKNAGDYTGSTNNAVVSSGHTVFDFSLNEIVYYTITGTITLPADQNGKTNSIIIRNSDYSYYHSTNIVLGSGTTCSYSFANAPEGTYTIASWVDVDKSGSTNAGDYIGMTNNAAMSSGHTNFDFSLAQITMYTVSGTVTLPAAQTGKHYEIAIFDSSYSTAGLSSGTVTGSSISYSISVPAGVYYIGSAVDVNNNSAFSDPGDYMGYYGGSGINPPASANVTVSGNTSGKNFSLGVE